jgi:hypothetical protein
MIAVIFNQFIRIQPRREGTYAGEAPVDETGRCWWFSTMPECPIIDEKSRESKA